MFEKILIATRGEVVLRIARTCERMGIATVAIHSDVEAGAPHVATCDEAVCVGGAAPRESYLNTAAIVAAAQRTGATAIHPGWGTLSQSAAFARAVQEAGLALIGAGQQTLAQLSDTPTARELARQAGVRILPYARVEPGGGASLAELASEIGYPLLVRASADDSIAERVDDAEELPQAVGMCRDRTAAACPDPRIHLEPCLDRPRLLAVVLMADARDCVPLGELERCSERAVTPRVLVDELPAPALVGLPDGALKRQILWDAAAAVAKEAGLVGPGTAEFLLDAHARLYFTRLRPGLPFEHALVEMCGGVDLVEAQIRIAAGERIPREVLRLQPSGNAMQARLSSTAHEAPAEITGLRWPLLAPGTLRVESDLSVGARPAVDYDPLIARIVTYGQTRHQALLTLDRVLAEATIEPLATNLGLLRKVLSDEAYRAGQYDTGFVDRLSAEVRDYT